MRLRRIEVVKPAPPTGEKIKNGPPNKVGYRPMDYQDYEKLPKCGATSKSKGTPCQLTAGLRTNHLGTGRCWLHGGRSSGPKDLAKFSQNKNSLKTGEHEEITPFADCLDPEELELWDNLTTDKVFQLDQEIKMLTVRERRMLKRIDKLLEGAEFTTVEITLIKQTGLNSMGAIDIDTKTEKQRGALTQVMDIEEALTRIQRQKSLTLDLKHKFEGLDDDDNMDKVNEKMKTLAQLLSTPQKNRSLPGSDDNDTSSTG